MSKLLRNLFCPLRRVIDSPVEIIREFPEASICPVISFNDEDIRADTLSAGASGFVVKDHLFELEDIPLNKSWY